ncbi:MAG TPA: 50S ribosomal protein L23 [Opitutae bacterium]|nr:50S ribosomal protein L23 [Opitutae bacterium]|tara:strand:+ start:14585 stop:14875 length:291 start_codon:yes stop_codon:yes gene_type:complete
MVEQVKVFKEYRVTEKSNLLASNLNQYTFEVFPQASKGAVSSAVEERFNVSVTRVNIINIKGKAKRSRLRAGRPGKKPDMKKAIVTLKEGDKIELI